MHELDIDKTTNVLELRTTTSFPGPTTAFATFPARPSTFQVVEAQFLPR